MLIRRPKPAARVSRRAVLRGVGVTVALPWLESLDAWEPTPEEFPKRFAVLYTGSPPEEMEFALCASISELWICDSLVLNTE